MGKVLKLLVTLFVVGAANSPLWALFAPLYSIQVAAEVLKTGFMTSRLTQELPKLHPFKEPTDSQQTTLLGQPLAQVIDNLSEELHPFTRDPSLKPSHLSQLSEQDTQTLSGPSRRDLIQFEEFGVVADAIRQFFLNDSKFQHLKDVAPESGLAYEVAAADSSLETAGGAEDDITRLADSSDVGCSEWGCPMQSTESVPAQDAGTILKIDPSPGQSDYAAQDVDYRNEAHVIAHLPEEIIRISGCFGFDPRVFAGLIYQESKLDADAKSRTGASGLTQLTLPAINEVSDQLGLRDEDHRAKGSKEILNAYLECATGPDQKWVNFWEDPEMKPQFDLAKLQQRGLRGKQELKLVKEWLNAKPQRNLLYGAIYFKIQLSLKRGNYTRALAGYNVGEAKVHGKGVRQHLTQINQYLTVKQADQWVHLGDNLKCKLTPLDIQKNIHGLYILHNVMAKFLTPAGLNGMLLNQLKDIATECSIIFQET